ncbi:MAG: hypothetical protein U0805_13325 [Pirellulales bacterium]
MIRYSVTFAPEALAALADIWISSSDRSSVTSAGDEIERILAINAAAKGEELREGMRQLTVLPLRILFSVNDDDRVATIWRVRLESSK